MLDMRSGASVDAGCMDMVVSRIRVTLDFSLHSRPAKPSAQKHATDDVHTCTISITHTCTHLYNLQLAPD